jgi:hypothetical protein
VKVLFVLSGQQDSIDAPELRDGAFAVVDIDTLWTRLEDGKDFYWEGSTCKIFTSRLLMARMEND